MKTAKNGKITEEMEIVAKNEQVDVEFIRRGVEKGRIIILNRIKENWIRLLALVKDYL